MRCGMFFECGLTEELKWRLPCYTTDGRNICIIQPMNAFAAKASTTGRPDPPIGGLREGRHRTDFVSSALAEQALAHCFYAVSAGQRQDRTPALETGELLAGFSGGKTDHMFAVHYDHPVGRVVLRPPATARPRHRQECDHRAGEDL